MQRLLPSVAPRAARCSPSDLLRLHDHCAGAKRLLVVTGAGVSTHSGIPDYRSPNGSYSRGHKPIQHAEFVKSEASRKRYWTRSFVGWQYFSRATPNAAHLALADLEAHQFVDNLITQNVDGLHTQAGSQHVLDLHGRIDAVECLSCGDVSRRDVFQQRLAQANSAWAASLEPLLPTELRADGDMELDAETTDFVLPSCARCGDGVLKPAVTFFGGSVPPSIVQSAADAVDRSDALLVLGSSLQVFSAFRLARAASRAGKPIAIVSNGPTRADELAALKLEADVCDTVPRLLAKLLDVEHGPPDGATDVLETAGRVVGSN